MSLLEQLQQSLGATFAIERELGGGGMSRVFLAEERALGRRVAIKVLPPDLCGGINVDRFRREIQLAATLQHPHIVPVFAASVVDGMPYFTMPFVEGESLRAHLKRGELPVAEVISILRDVTKALAYAHTHGVVHRDIKPDNVLLSSHAATVTDFGVAKALSESTSPGAPLTATGMALGTPAYMSPEQASADPNVDARTDIYALGVLAYEMLMGQPPFGGRSAQQILAAHMTESVPAVNTQRASVPDALSDLVAWCLAKRPADRPQTAEQVVPAIAASVAAVVVIALVAWRPWQSRAVADAPAPAAQSGQPAPIPKFRPTSIVVAPFTNMTNDTSLNVLGAIAAQTLSDGLSQLDSVTVMTPTTGMMDSTGALRRFAGADAVRALGRESKAASVVWGSFQRDGDSLRFKGQVIDVKDGRVQITLDAVSGPAKSPTAAIEALRDRVVNAIDATKLNERLGAMGRPPNMAAYREFLAGLHEKWDGRAPNTSVAALPFFEAASRLDTTFTIASYYVVLMQTNVSGATQVRATRLRANQSAESVLKVMTRRKHLMNAVELEFLAAAAAAVKEDQQTTLRITQRMQARDSSLRMFHNVSISAMFANRPDVTLGAFRAWGTRPIPENWVSTMALEPLAHHRLGAHEQELKSVVKWRAKVPNSPGLRWREANALAALGRIDPLRTITDSITGAWDGTGNPTWWRDIAFELRAHGHEAAAIRYADDGLAMFRSHPPLPANVRNRTYAIADLLMIKGAFDSVRTLVAPLVAGGDSINPAKSFLAMVGPTLGDTTMTLRVMAVLDTAAKNPYEHGRAQRTQARLAAVLGRKDEAVRYLKAAFAAGVPYDFGIDVHVDPAFSSLRTYPPFQALIQPKK
jgi:serine/threonine protein kinase